jgi:hypothetical protein
MEMAMKLDSSDCGVLRRGILGSDAQRTPGTALSAAAKAEVEYLLARIARHDERARLSDAKAA